MHGNQLLLICSLVVVQTIFVHAAPPAWVPPELIDMVQDDKARCMAEHGTTQAQIDEVNDGVLVKNKPIACYMYCMLESFSLADEDGNLEAETLISLVPENLQALGNDILNKCAKQDGEDNCDKIFNVAKCVQATVPELWFMV